jgi:hypothetical protein
MKDIKKVSKEYFDFYSEEPLLEFGFSLIHLVRNDNN